MRERRFKLLDARLEIHQPVRRHFLRFRPQILEFLSRLCGFSGVESLLNI